MLRITVQDADPGSRLILEGRLSGPWVREAEECWQSALAASHDKPMTIDLTDVDFVDASGESLLAAMHRHGARFVAACPLTRYLVEQIAGPQAERSRRPAFQTIGRAHRCPASRALAFLLASAAALAASAAEVLGISHGVLR